MKNVISTGLVALSISWGTVNASGLDGSRPLVCASATVMECLPLEGCRQVAPEGVGAPTGMRIDLSKKKITSTAPEGDGRSTKIERSETIDGKLILQGAEDGIEGVRDGLGWTIAISEGTGNMVVSASGDDVSFTIFGVCTPI